MVVTGVVQVPESNDSRNIANAMYSRKVNIVLYKLGRPYAVQVPDSHSRSSSHSRDTPQHGAPL